MDNLTMLEQELEAILPATEADLEPNIPELDEEFEDDGGETSFEMAEPEDDDMDYGDNLLEYIESEDYADNFAEGRRREKANEKRSKINHRRSVTNQKNIIKINRTVIRNKKTGIRNSKRLSKEMRRSRIMEKRNWKDHRRIKIDVGRVKRAVRVVGRRSGKNTEMLELMGLMAIPRLVGNVVTGQINELVVTELVPNDAGNGLVEVERTLKVKDQSNDLLSSLAPSVADATALIGRYTNTSNYVLAGVALVLTALFGSKALQRSSN